jgi:hypothetical protein
MPPQKDEVFLSISNAQNPPADPAPLQRGQPPNWLVPGPDVAVDPLRPSLKAAQPLPVDRAQRMLQLRAATGLPPSLISRHFDELDRLDKERRLDPAELRKLSPAVAAFLGDPTQAAAVAREVPKLQQLEKTTSAAAPILRSIQQMQSSLYAFAEVSGEATGLQALIKAGREGRERNRLEAAAYGESADLYGAFDSPSDFAHYVTSTVMEQIPILGSTLAGAAAGAAVGSVVPVVGTTLGAVIGAFVPSFVLNVGDTQASLKEIAGDVSAPAAIFIGGSAIAAFDTVLPGRIGSRLVRTFGRETAEQIARRALTQPVKRKFMAATARGVVKGVTSEAIPEAIQEAIGYATTHLATGAPVDVAEMGWQALAAGVAGGLTGGAVEGTTTAATWSRDQKRTLAAQQQKDYFTLLGQQVQDTELLAQQPEIIQRFVAEATKHGPIETVYLPTKEFEEYFQEKGMNPTAVAELLTGDRTALEKAKAEAIDMPISMARYAATLAGTEHHAFFRTELKMAPELPNMREVTAEAERGVTATADVAAEDAATADARQEIAGRVRGVIGESMPAWQAGPVAELLGQHIVERARRKGVDPIALWEAQPLELVTREASGLALAMQQPLMAPRAVEGLPESPALPGETRVQREQRERAHLAALTKEAVRAAQALDPTVDVGLVGRELEARVRSQQELQQLQREGEAGQSLLRAIAGYGGLWTVEGQQHHGEIGELAREGGDAKERGRPQTWNQIAGVFKAGGLPPDVMLQSLQQTGEFQRLETVDDLLTAVTAALRARPDRDVLPGTAGLRALGITPETRWWEAPWFEEPPEPLETEPDSTVGDISFDPNEFTQGRPVAQPLEDLGERVQQLEALATESALGIEEVPAADQDRLGQSTRFTGHPDLNPVNCTDCAEVFLEKSGLEGVIVGYPEDVNTGEIADGMGHDFAVVEGRYLVDPWAAQVEQSNPRAVFDLHDPLDAAYVASRYAPMDVWTERQLKPPDARGDASWQRRYDWVPWSPTPDAQPESGASSHMTKGNELEAREASFPQRHVLPHGATVVSNEEDGDHEVRLPHGLGSINLIEPPKAQGRAAARGAAADIVRDWANLPQRYLYIDVAQVTHPRQGDGRKLYEAAMAFAKSRGYAGLSSHWKARTEASSGLWKAMERDGSVRRQAINGYDVVTHTGGEFYQARRAPVPASVRVASSMRATVAAVKASGRAMGRLQLKSFIQRRVKAAARAAGLRELNPADPQVRAYVVQQIVAEARDAITRHGNALGWYALKVPQMRQVMALTFPELLTDPEAWFTFTYALAATSNGLTVKRNLELAAKAYEHFQKKGTLPTNIGEGTNKKQINKTLAKFNQEVRTRGSRQAYFDFLMTHTTRRGLQEQGYTNIEALIEEDVYGAAILGPKIGNGFFLNLNAVYSQLTADRWFSRTWARFTGTLILKDRVKIANNRVRLRQAVAGLSRLERDLAESVLGAPLARSRFSDPQIDALAVEVRRASASEALRIPLSEGAIDELRLAGNTLADNLEGERETPLHNTERALMRAVVGEALAALRAEGYTTLTVADLQAMLWYPEKRLYESAKDATDDAEAYQDTAAPDYANAAVGWAHDRAISQEATDAALERGTAAARRAGRVERGDGPRPGVGHRPAGRVPAGRVSDEEFYQPLGGEPAPASGVPVVEQLWSRVERIIETSPVEKATAHDWHGVVKNAKIGVNLDELEAWGLASLPPDQVYTKQQLLEAMNRNRVFVIALEDLPDSVVLDPFEVENLAQVLQEDLIRDEYERLRESGEYPNFTYSDITVRPDVTEDGDTVYEVFVKDENVEPGIYFDTEAEAREAGEAWVDRTMERVQDLIMAAAQDAATWELAEDEARTQLSERVLEHLVQFSEFTQPGAVEGSYRELALCASMFTSRQAAQEAYLYGLIQQKRELADEVPNAERRTRLLAQAAVVQRIYDRRKAQGLLTPAELRDDRFSFLTDEEQEELPRQFARDLRNIATGPEGRLLAWGDGHEAYQDRLENPIVRVRYAVHPFENGHVLWIDEGQPPMTSEQQKMPAVYRKHWKSLMMRWALQYAATHSLTHVAWTTGEMQMLRWPHLRKTATRVVYFPELELLEAYVGDNYAALRRWGVPATELGRWLGEDVAAQLQQQTPQLVASGEHNAGSLRLVLEQTPVQVGGEGIIDLYDRQFKADANALPIMRRTKSKVTTITMPDIVDRVTYQGPDVTLQMLRDDIQHVGTSLSAMHHTVSIEAARVAAAMDNWNLPFGQAVVRAGAHATAWFYSGRIIEQRESSSVQAIEITPRMRSELLGKGSEYFQPAGGAPEPRTLITTGTRELGVDRVRTPQDLANAVGRVKKSDVERLEVLLTDGEGRPLAIVGSVTGGATMDPAAILEEARQVSGATRAWLVHNHSAGEPLLTEEDGATLAAVAQAFGDSGVQVTGLMAIGEGYISRRYTWQALDGTRATGIVALDRIPAGLVPVRERQTILPSPAGELAQPMGAEPPGGIRGSYNRMTRRITMIAGASNLTTFLHENGHAFLDELMEDAREAEARLDDPAATDLQRGLVRDAHTVLRWFNFAGPIADWQALDAQQQRSMHEQWAKGFERFLMSGEAPSPEMRGLFATFRTWLSATYRWLLKFGSPADRKTAKEILELQLPQDVKDVMARLLASDEAIAAARNEGQILPLFTDQASAGVDPLTWAAYQQTVADASLKAREALDQRLLAEWREQQRVTFQRERETVRAQVESQAQRDPLFVAQSVIRTGKMPDGTIPTFGDGQPMKLSRSAIVAMKGENFLKQLPRPYLYTRTGGLHPDVLAELVNFTSGDALLESLAGSRAIRPVVEQETDARMREQHGDALLDGLELQQLAEQAIYSNRAEIISAELKALTQGMAAQHLASPGALKAAAETRIARTPIKDLRPGLFLSAAQRASQRAFDAFARNDRVAAVRAKQEELTSLALYRAAAEAKDRAQKSARLLHEFQNSPGRRKNLLRAGEDYLDQVDALLERYEFTRTTLKAQERRSSLSAWVTKQLEAGLPVQIPEWIVTDARRVNYVQLTVEELEGIRLTVDHVAHLARLKNKLLDAKEQREFDQVVADLSGSIRANNAAVSRDVETSLPGEQRKRFTAGLGYSHRKIASLARELDGFKDGGPMWSSVIRPLNEAGNAELTMNGQALEAMLRLYQVFTPKERADFTTKISVPELATTKDPRPSYTKQALLVLLLNQGNETNRLRARDSYGWTQEQIQKALDNHLSRRDFEWAQSVWDYLETWWPLIVAKQLRVTGAPPEKVQATPVFSRHGEFRGGYYPIAFNGELSSRTVSLEEASLADMHKAAAYIHATTARGHVERRVEGSVTDQRIRLDLNVITEHLGKVIHDLTHHEVLIDVGRIMHDRDVREAIYDTLGPGAFEQFRTALRDIALGDPPARHEVEAAFSYLRTGATFVGLSWNVMTSALQVVGFTQSVQRIGAGWVGRGIGSYLRGAVTFEGTAKAITQESEFMRNRFANLSPEVHDARRRLGINNGRFVNELDRALRGVSGGRLTQQAIADSRLILIAKAQQLVDIPTYLGAKAKAMADPENKRPDGTIDEARVIALAEQAVIDSQGAGQTKDLAAVQRGGPSWKVWINFYSFFNLLYNAWAESWRRAGGRLSINPRNPFAVGRLAVDFLLLFTIPTLASHAIRSLLTPGDDPEAKDTQTLLVALLREHLSYMAGTTVIGRELSGAIEGWMGYEGPAGARGISTASKFVTQVAQMETDEAFWVSVNQTFGVLLHYPASQVERTTRGMLALVHGETQNPFAVLFGPPRQNP